MMTALTIYLALIISSLSSSTDPFKSYIAQVKVNRPSPKVQSFASECGVGLAGRKPRHAVNMTGTWNLSRNLPRDIQNLEGDSFDTAEMWTAHDGAKVLDWWDIDLGQDDIDTLFCLNSNGQVRFLEATKWSFVDEGYPAIEWVYKQRRNFDASGKLLSKEGHFEDTNGRVIRPKLTHSEESGLDWVPKGSSLKDFGLEEVWHEEGTPARTR